MNPTFRVTAAMAFIIATLTAANPADLPAAPQLQPQPVAADEWVVSTTPYFWIYFYEGDLTINGQTVDLSGTNTFDLLQAGDLSFPPLVNYFEVRKGRWGGYLDTTLIGLEASASNISLGPGPVTAAAGLDFTYALVNAGLIYTVAERSGQNGSVAFDLMGGARYTYYDADLNVTVGPLGASFSDTLDWWDVTLGGRLRARYDNGWNYTLYADIAGAGLESDLSVQAMANIGRDFQLGRFDMTAIAGYRLLYQDWSDGNDAVDLLTHGPLVGLKVHF